MDEVSVLVIYRFDVPSAENHELKDLVDELGDSNPSDFNHADWGSTNVYDSDLVDDMLNEMWNSAKHGETAKEYGLKIHIYPIAKSSVFRVVVVIGQNDKLNDALAAQESADAHHSLVGGLTVNRGKSDEQLIRIYSKFTV